MKKGLLLCLLLSCVFLLSSCAASKETSAVVKDGSYLAGWYVDEGSAFFVCNLIIENTDDEAKMVNIYAYSEEDVGGLLKTAKLIGYNENMTDSFFRLESGMNQIVVVFKGTFAGVENKKDDAIPDKIVITESER